MGQLSVLLWFTSLEKVLMSPTPLQFQDIIYSDAVGTDDTEDDENIIDVHRIRTEIPNYQQNERKYVSTDSYIENGGNEFQTNFIYPGHLENPERSERNHIDRESSLFADDKNNLDTGSEFKTKQRYIQYENEYLPTKSYIWSSFTETPEATIYS